jgi:hypothetical protein
MMPNGRLKIQLAFNNVRYMTAHGVGADLAVTTQTLPERTNLGQAHSWQINIGELAPTEQGKDGSLQVFWLEFSQMEVNRMNWRQQTVKVEGELLPQRLSRHQRARLLRLLGKQSARLCRHTK